MPFTNYAELQTEIGNWMTRSNLGTRIPDFITLCEARINRRLRTSEMEFRATASTAAGDPYIALPDSFKQMRALRITGTSPPYRITFATPQQMDAMKGREEQNRPKVMNIEGNELRLLPTPDAVYELTMVYTAGVDALSDSNTTNWLLARHPDVYLNGSLTEACKYVRDWTRRNEYKADFNECLAEARREEIAKKWNAGPLESRPDFQTP